MIRGIAALSLLVALFAAALAITRSTPLEPADFTFNNGAEVSTLDPAAISSLPEGRIVRALFEGLCVKDPATLEPLPGMAESWEVSEDGKTYTFRIRGDARWSNGDRVTARDFEYSWRRVLHPETAAEYAYLLWPVRGGEEYTRLPDDRLYAIGERPGVWVRELGEGRVRLGVTAYELESATGEEEISLREGLANRPELPAGQPFGLLGDGASAPAIAVPFPIAVRSVNDRRPRTVEALREDPYGAGWLLEAHVEPGVLDRLREAGSLLEGDHFRRRIVDELHLGLRALDDQRFEVQLERPTPYFLDLAGFYPLYPVHRGSIEEAKRRWPADWRLKWLRPENLVTNGPYRIGFRRIADRIRLVKNPTYWDAGNVAFETIDALAIDHLGTSLNLYLTGQIDWIDRPVPDLIPLLREREDFHAAPFLGTYFYRVNTTEPPFDDARVRRALALAIDRRRLVERITRAGEEPAFALTTPRLPGYPRVELAHAETGDEREDFAADVAEAKRLLAEVGFGPRGRPFPVFEILYNTDEVHRDVAEVIADGWRRHLAIEVKLQSQEWKVYLDSQRTLDYDVVRASWIGDYVDPNTFLDVFVTGGENNRTGWGNQRYDRLIAEAASELDRERRLALLAEAESILLEELPILPIYHYVTRNLVNPRLGGFHDNVRDEHFCKFWHWREPAPSGGDG